MDDRPLIVGLGGTLRPDSSSEKALATALNSARADGAQVVSVTGSELELPMYSPNSHHRSSQAQRLLELLRDCDGLIIASPSYHGSVSGLIKNALDYVEDLRGDSRTYLDGRAVGCIVTAQGWHAIGSTLVVLRNIVHALRGWPTPLGVGINAAALSWDERGRISDDEVDAQLRLVGQQVVEFALMRLARRAVMRDLVPFPAE